MNALHLACLLLAPQHPAPPAPPPPSATAAPTQAAPELALRWRYDPQSENAGEGRVAEARVAVPARQGRSWIGVELASREDGKASLEVARAVDGSPAERAGLAEGDRLIALDGAELASFDDLRGRLDQLEPGAKVELTFHRSLEVRLDERGWGEASKPRLGLRLSEDGGRGLVVGSVEPGWPAEAAGVLAGDRIVAVGGRDLTDFDQLTDVLGATEPGHGVELGIERRAQLELGTFPEGAQSTPGGSGGAWRLGPSDPGRPPQVFGLPGGGQEFRLQPLIPGQLGLEAELRSLRDELRELREELRALRAELDDLRRSRGR